MASAKKAAIKPIAQAPPLLVCDSVGIEPRGYQDGIIWCFLANPAFLKY